MSENGNAAHALREAARRKIYRELKLSDFDPTFEGAVKVRVNLTHGEAVQLQEIGDEIRKERQALDLLPGDDENRATREETIKRIGDLNDRYLIFIGGLLGLNEIETLDFFRNDRDEQDPVFERWVVDAAAELVKEYRDTDFLARKTPSAVGSIP